MIRSDAFKDTLRPKTEMGNLEFEQKTRWQSKTNRNDSWNKFELFGSWKKQPTLKNNYRFKRWNFYWLGEISHCSCRLKVFKCLLSSCLGACFSENIASSIRSNDCQIGQVTGVLTSNHDLSWCEPPSRRRYFWCSRISLDELMMWHWMIFLGHILYIHYWWIRSSLENILAF